MRMPLPSPALPAGWIPPALRETLHAVGTTAHRLATAADGWVEQLGEAVLISYTHAAALARFQAELATWGVAAGVTWPRVYSKHLPLQNADRIAPVLETGDPAQPAVGSLREAGLHFGLDFAAGYSNGFFIDQRANRARVRELRPPRLLNTFAYTCSFSVVAAAGGGLACSVDLSRKSLDRGRANFAANDFPTEGHTFLADDVLEVLPRLVRRGEQYDCIILDPPTFSRGNNGKRFQVEEHLADLLALGLQLAAPRASVLLSTNCHRFRHTDLKELARFGLRHARRSGRVEPGAPLPDFPPGSAAQTVWLMLQ